MSRIGIGIVLAVLLGVGLGQEFDGTFSTEGDAGAVTLELRQNGLQLSGELSGNGNTFRLRGEVAADEPSVAFGSLEGPGVELVFEAYREGARLELYLFSLLEDGAIDFEDVTALAFAAAPAGSAPGPAGAPAGPAGPLGAGQPGANPLATPDRFSGTFSGDEVTLELQRLGETYSGSLTFQGSAYPVSGRLEGEALAGTFSVGATAYPFSLREADGAFVLESDGARYRLAATGATLASPPSTGAGQAAAAPPAGGPGAPQGDGSRVLASGAYGQLTEDAALAFIEALEFSLQQVGQSQVLAGTTREQIAGVLANGYPSFDADTQMVLANARQIWTETMIGWANAPLAEQREFVFAVLTIAYGEEAARSALGGGAAAGADGAGGGNLIMPSPDAELQQDTQNAQSCWAAAGCADYDPVMNDFDFDDY